MLDDLKKDAAERMAKCVVALQSEFKRLRTGRASTALLDSLRVEYYGAEMPLTQVANVAVEDSRTLTITPWDKTMVQAIEKAIFKSDLGLTPNTAGSVIRLSMPPLTEERRKEIAKSARAEAENARVAVRNVRRDIMNELRDMVKEKLVSQDDDRRAQDEIQKLTDKYVHDIDGVLAAKEKELLSV